MWSCLLLQSFPSGHASNSMSVAWYTVLYLMWSLYLRVDAPYPRRLYWGSTFWGRLMGEVSVCSATVWLAILHLQLFSIAMIIVALKLFLTASHDNDAKLCTAKFLAAGMHAIAVETAGTHVVTTVLIATPRIAWFPGLLASHASML